MARPRCPLLTLSHSWPERVVQRQRRGYGASGEDGWGLICPFVGSEAVIPDPGQLVYTGSVVPGYVGEYEVAVVNV